MVQWIFYEYEKETWQYKYMHMKIVESLQLNQCLVLRNAGR